MRVEVMPTVLRRPVVAVAVAVAAAGLAAGLADGTPTARPMTQESVESRLAAAGLRVEDAPIEIPAPQGEVCGMAIFDYAAGSTGPPTPRDAVIERVLGFSIGDEPRSGVLAPVTEGEKTATWVFVPDDGTSVTTYHLSATPGGGWIVGSSGVDCLADPGRQSIAMLTDDRVVGTDRPPTCNS